MNKSGFFSQTEQKIMSYPDATHGKPMFHDVKTFVLKSSLVLFSVSFLVRLLLLFFPSLFVSTPSNIPPDVHHHVWSCVFWLPITCYNGCQSSPLPFPKLMCKQFTWECPCVLKVENIVHILHKNALQMARNKVWWSRIRVI